MLVGFGNTDIFRKCDHSQYFFHLEIAWREGIVEYPWCWEDVSSDIIHYLISLCAAFNMGSWDSDRISIGYTLQIFYRNLLFLYKPRAASSEAANLGNLFTVFSWLLPTGYLSRISQHSSESWRSSYYPSIVLSNYGFILWGNKGGS